MNSALTLPVLSTFLGACTWFLGPLAGPARAQVTDLVSQPQGYQIASWPSTSSAGRWVAYLGYMPDPVIDGTVHVFVRDRLNGVTYDLTPLPPPPSGGSPNHPSISSDGQWVAYTRSLAVAHNGTTYIFPQILKESAVGGAFEVVSRSSTGVPANFPCMEPRCSLDARFIAFQSRASNLAPELKVNGPGDNDIFLRDTLLGTTVLVSVSASGGTTADEASVHPAISLDGRHVAFESSASDLVASGANARVQIYVRDVPNGVTTLVSAPGGVSANQHCSSASLSADGRFVAYETNASNVVAGDTNSSTDVFVCDRDPDGDQILDEGNSVTTRVSVADGGIQVAGTSDNAAISGDGRIVVFRSLASTLVPGDSNQQRDVFAHDRWTATTWLASVDSSFAQGNDDSGTASNHGVDISPDGRHAVFMSDATNLVAGDTNGRTDIFSRELGIAIPEIYCTAKINSQGCTPGIGSGGLVPSLSDPLPYYITASSVINNKNGLLFYGYAPQALPFQGGTLCIKPPTKRTPLQNSGGNPPPADCSGSFILDFNAHLQSGINPALTAYRLVYAQYWYRDPAHTGPYPTGLTDALQMSIAP